MRGSSRLRRPGSGSRERGHLVQKTIKLTGAALAASALGLFASRGADAQEVSLLASQRCRCHRRGDDSCKCHGCHACCGAGERHEKACCGKKVAVVAAETSVAPTGCASSRARLSQRLRGDARHERPRLLHACRERPVDMRHASTSRRLPQRSSSVRRGSSSHEGRVLVGFHSPTPTICK
jgi:hypothetical protein